MRVPRPITRLQRALALVLVLLACPCATEVVVHAVVAELSAEPPGDSCCPDRKAGTPTPDEERDAPTRSSCACCHKIERLALPAPVAARAATPLAPPADTTSGDVADAHVEPPFRPPSA